MINNPQDFDSEYERVEEIHKNSYCTISIVK